MSRLAAVQRSIRKCLAALLHSWLTVEKFLIGFTGITGQYGALIRNAAPLSSQVGCTLGRINAKDYAKRNGSGNASMMILKNRRPAGFLSLLEITFPAMMPGNMPSRSGTACHQDQFGQKLQYVFLLHPRAFLMPISISARSPTPTGCLLCRCIRLSA